MSFSGVWTLVWTVNLWESDWILSLFGDNIRQLVQQPEVINNAILVVNNVPSFHTLFNAYEQAGYTYCILHLSDEELTPVVYPASCACVFRNYYNPTIKDPRIVYLPLGYKSGFPTHVSASKEYDWVFAGDIKKSDRRDMSQALHSVGKNGYVHTIQGFNSSDCLPVKDYATLMMSSWFAPSPIGSKNAECFRTWEALEAGTIPIVPDSSPFHYISIPHYYDTLVKACGFNEPVPFPVLTSWKDIETVPWEQAPALQQKCVEWWDRFKASLKQTCTNALTEHAYVEHVKKCLERAQSLQSKLPETILSMDGMSGTMTRHFYNNLMEYPNVRYLEIGTWKGSTFVSALYGNTVDAVAIDNWAEFGGPKTEFIQNVVEYKGNNNVTVIEQDCFSVDVRQLPKFNIYMYDGNHSYESHFKALTHFIKCMDDLFIFIVDDWNWNDVRTGTKNAMELLNLNVLWEKEIRLTQDGSSTPHHEAHTTWWNGIYVAIIKQNISV